MGRNRCTGTAAGVAQAFALSMGEVEVDPLIIRYTHSRIRPFFSGCGRRVLDTLADIVEGRMELKDLPKIQVIIAEGGHVFSLNNRRLFVLKSLREQGLLPNNVVTVRTRPGKTHEIERYTPERCSLVGKLLRERSGAKKGASKDGDNGSDSQDDANAAPAADVEDVAVQQAIKGKDGEHKIVGVPTSELDQETVAAHAKRVDELLEGVDMDDDL